MNRLLLCSVLLEPRRWSPQRPPLVRVSQWSKAAAQVFSGWELWEDHWLFAEASERSALLEGAMPVCILSSYASFGPMGRDSRTRTLAAVQALQPSAMKFNFPSEEAQMPAAADALREFSRELPNACRLLCECHPGTQVESPAKLAAWQAQLDLPKFGLIVHPFAQEVHELEHWMNRFGNRIGHLHIQAAQGRRRVPLHMAGSRAEAAVYALRSSGFRGTASIEFTEGVAEAGEDTEKLFRNAARDAIWLERRLYA